MTVVKGSKQEHLVVVSYDPWTRFFKRLLLLIIIAALGGASYLFGRFEAAQVQSQAIAERDQLKEDLQMARDEMASFSQRVIMLEKGGEVAQNMQNLYQHCGQALLQASIKNDLSYIDSTRVVMNNLQEGWQGLGTQ